MFLQSLERDHHQSEVQVEAVCSVDARSKVRKMKGRFFIYYCLYCLMTPDFCWKFGSCEQYDKDVADFTDMGSYDHGVQKNLNTGRNGVKPPGGVTGK